MNEFYTLLTNYGIAKIAQARANKQTINLSHIAVGDAEIVPSESMSALKSEKHRLAINSIIQDENNPSYLIIERVIPASVGGFYINEVGIFDESGNLFAIGNLPKTYKPLLSEGSAKDLTLKIIIELANASEITLKVDNSVVLATRKWTETLINKKEDKGVAENLINVANENIARTYATKTEVDTKVNVKANANATVNLTGNQTIAGVKTFSSPIVVPNATANTHAVNLAQLNTKANQATTYTKTEVANIYLAKSGKAADSDKLDGKDSTAFALKTDLAYATEAKAGIIKLKNSITGNDANIAVTEKAVRDFMNNGFLNLKAVNGYTRLPNGLILQWGKVMQIWRDRRKTAIFPIAFPTACLNASVAYEAPTKLTDLGGVAYVTNISRSQMEVEYQALVAQWENQPYANIYWFAIGY